MQPSGEPENPCDFRVDISGLNGSRAMYLVSDHNRTLATEAAHPEGRRIMNRASTMKVSPSAVFTFAVLQLALYGSGRFIAVADGSLAAEHVALLKIEQAVLLKASATGNETAQLNALTDGDIQTSVSFSATQDAPLEVVYGFGNETVSPEKLVVHLADANGEGCCWKVGTTV
jgi:hypothetical protein